MNAPASAPFTRLALLGAISAFPLVASLLAADSHDEVVKMDKYVATAKEDDLYNILPNRESSSLFGNGSTLLETPRSITVIESGTSDLYAIRTVNDFVAVTAGTFTGNYFGVPGALDVRGERADNFFRGFRRIENRGNFPTVVTSSDFVEVIKGPPPPIYGGGKVGGILNFIPKTAMSDSARFIDHPIGAVSATVGTYGKKLGSIEYGAPFKIGDKRSGVYVYLQGERSDSYYTNVYDHDFIAQVAVDTEISPSLKLEYGGMFQRSNLNQSLGWNRVTQKLIDTETYLAGRPAVNLDTNHNGYIDPTEIPQNQMTAFAFPGFAGAFRFSPDFATQRALFALDPASIHEVKLNHHTVQVEPSDFVKTDAFTGFFDVVYTPKPDIEVKNQSFYDSMNHTKYSSYGFTARYTAMVFENKTTADVKLEPFEKIHTHLVTGFSWRYSDGDERESRDIFQVLDRRDISVGATPNDRFEGAWDGKGLVPYNWRQIGAFSDTGGFLLLDNKIAERLGFIASGRYDYYQAHTFGTDLSPTMLYVSDSKGAFTYNLSANYQLPFGLVPYVTYSTSNYLELGQGGMIDRINLGQGTWTQKSKLTEGGVKGALWHNRLYVTLTQYRQQKTSFNAQSGDFDRYLSRGTELEFRFAPNKQWSFTGASTWQKTTQLNSPFFLGVPPAAVGLTGPEVYGGRLIGVGALLGVTSPAEFPSPRRIYSLFATYTSRDGWGVSFGGTHVASFYSGFLKQILLPSYTVYKGSIFYQQGRWRTALQVNNIFNEKYYTPQFLFWDSFISPSQGTTGDVTVTYRW